ncbi:glycosylated lysosomal membrane protein [Trichosurus vulpecula]|uniref:glycosylated lysosomal membrane protein n=1 Tax=Trichosurus vulpecula TaxID=9337 RepID=UPI00186B05A6|nr:glycosylated lysosomal membrane protein [Trichosurus vulpecula]XP_036613869.1 glycosylated lysosomal membrane protein [Trichosurus vulpecula]
MFWERPQARRVPASRRSLLLLQCLLLLRAPAGLLGDQTRRVSLEVIPWRTALPQNLLHIRAVGANSTIHYLWSSLGPPAVLFVATDTPHSVLSVNWSCLAVLPAESVRFSSALIFPRLFEFDSTNSSEVKDGSPGKPYPPYLLANFSWDDINSTLDPTKLSATLQGCPSKDPSGAFSNGSLAFKVQAFSSSGRPDHLPRLLHTADTSQLEVVLSGVVPQGNHSLFGLEVATPALDSECPQLKKLDSIDDEYCPSVFQLDQLLWRSPPEGFLQWRPIAFSQKQPAWKTALPCRVSPPAPTLSTLLPQLPIVRAFFGPSVNFCTFNLTFGDSTGPAYEDQRYLSWSAVLGIGIPTMDSFSPLVLGIMAVVMGLPALLLVGGGLSLLLIRHRRYSEYEPIN